MAKSVCQTFDNVTLEGYSVDHVSSPDGSRVVGVRIRDGVYLLDMSDTDLGNREELQVRNRWQAERLTITFVSGQSGDLEFPVLFINQNDRECCVVKVTPTRARVEYEMPNAGLMAGWQYRTVVGSTGYFSHN